MEFLRATGDVIFLLTVARYSCIFAVLLGVAFKAAMVSGCRPQPTGVHSVAMMNVGGKIVVECVPDQEVSGSSPIVPVDWLIPVFRFLLNDRVIISSRDAFPYPRSVVCFLRFHRELF